MYRPIVEKGDVMKRLKSFISIALALVLVIPMALVLTACGSDDKAKNTLSLSVNPEITFVLDGKNNVTSIMYGNSDASTLLINNDLIGKNIDKVIKTFIEQSVITGHIDISGDEITISVSGSGDLDSLVNVAKEAIDSSAKAFGVQLQATVDTATAEAKHAYLLNMVTALYPEMTSDELSAKTDAELVKLLDARQKEYEGLVYEQVQNVISVIDGTISQTVIDLKNTLKGLKDDLASVLPAGKELIETQISAIEKQIDDAVKAFNDTKNTQIALLKNGIATIKANALDIVKTSVANTKAGLVAHLDSAKTAGTITEAQYNYALSLINSYNA